MYSGMARLDWGPIPTPPPPPLPPSFTPPINPSVTHDLLDHANSNFSCLVSGTIISTVPAQRESMRSLISRGTFHLLFISKTNVDISWMTQPLRGILNQYDWALKRSTNCQFLTRICLYHISKRYFGCINLPSIDFFPLASHARL